MSNVGVMFSFFSIWLPNTLRHHQGVSHDTSHNRHLDEKPCFLLRVSRDSGEHVATLNDEAKLVFGIGISTCSRHKPACLRRRESRPTSSATIDAEGHYQPCHLESAL